MDSFKESLNGKVESHFNGKCFGERKDLGLYTRVELEKILEEKSSRNLLFKVSTFSKSKWVHHPS